MVDAPHGRCDVCGVALPCPPRFSGRRRVHCSKGCARKAEKRRARLRARIADLEGTIRVLEAIHGHTGAARAELEQLRAELVEAS